MVSRLFGPKRNLKALLDPTDNCSELHQIAPVFTSVVRLGEDLSLPVVMCALKSAKTLLLLDFMGPFSRSVGERACECRVNNDSYKIVACDLRVCNTLPRVISRTMLPPALVDVMQNIAF